MKKINLFSRLWSSGGNSQSSDVGYDCRRSDLRRSPSGLESSTLLKFVSVLVLVLTIGVGQMWGTTVTYTITTTSAVSTSGTAPVGSSASFATTYTDKNQLVEGYTHTLTLSNYGIVAVTNITLSMKSNSSKGAGKLYYSTNGGTDTTYVIGSATDGSKFNTADWYGSWSTDYVDVSKDVAFVTQSGKNLMIGIKSTQSSIYCASYTITYNTDKYTVTYDAQSGECGTSSAKQANPGASLTLPSATPDSDCGDRGWTFGGWKKTSAATNTIIPPVLYAASSSYVPADDETLYAVYKYEEERIGCSAGKISSTGELAVGDIVLLYYETGLVQFDGSNDSYGDKTGYTTNPAESHVLLVLEGASSGQFAFYDMTDKVYLALNSAGNNLHRTTSVTSNSSWTVAISDGDAAITNVEYPTRSIRYNTGSPRFACYEGTQQIVQLYKLCSDKVTYNSNPVCIFDSFIDIMHDNVIADRDGTYAMPNVSDATPGDTYCDEKHYHFMGWVEESYINEDGTLNTSADGYALYPAGHAGHTAANKTFYAIWAKE